MSSGLLPCYRDMDPYDMPEALSVLQSYDMSKIGFIQDLTRGIAKVLDAEKKPQHQERIVVQQHEGTSIDALLKRGYMALEDSDWTATIWSILKKRTPCFSPLENTRTAPFWQLSVGKKSIRYNTRPT